MAKLFLFGPIQTIPDESPVHGGIPAADDIARARALDLDHLGAHIGQHLGRMRTGQRRLQRQHAHAIQRAARLSRRLSVITS